MMRHARTVALAALGAAILAAGSTAVAQDEAAADLVKRATDALPRVPFKAKLRLTPNDVPPREIELSHKVVGGARASYLEVLAPEELAGIRFLFLERGESEPEQYIKIASATSPVRVKDAIRKQPFLDSAFYISDLVEPELDAFNYRFVGEEEILGRKTKLVEAVPKNPDREIYGKTIIAIDPGDLLFLKRQFFDKKGNLLKVWTIDKVEKVDGIWTIRDQHMENVQEKKNARLETTDIRYNVELKDSMFSPEALRR